MNPFATFLRRHDFVPRPVVLLFALLLGSAEAIAQEKADHTDPSIERDFRFSIGVAAGYGALAMDDVNQHLQEVGAALAALDIQEGPPDQIKGGVYLEGNASVRYRPVIAGILVNYLTDEAAFSYSDFRGQTSQKAAVSTLEAVVTAGLAFTLSPTAEACVRAGIGYGHARAHLEYEGMAYSDLTSKTSGTHDLEGGYLATRTQFDLSFLAGPALLSIGIGYRFADAGDLVGESTTNGVSNGTSPVKDRRGRIVGFDYSGLFAWGGVSLVL